VRDGGRQGPPVTRQPDAPRHVVATDADADAVLRRLTRDGWTVREGFALPDHTRDVGAAGLVLHGRVADDEALQQAVLAAARGAGIVAVSDPATPVGRALIDDLSRLGPVHHGAAEPRNAIADLIPEQRALLDRLAAGDTIAAAAAAEFLSLRTANRRIAEARALFGVRTTREAVLAYLRQRRVE
jgi:DNA-binding NarL/FixJ family response regulator